MLEHMHFSLQQMQGIELIALVRIGDASIATVDGAYIFSTEAIIVAFDDLNMIVNKAI